MDWASEHFNFVAAAYALSLITLGFMAWRVFMRRKALRSQFLAYDLKLDS